MTPARGGSPGDRRLRSSSRLPGGRLAAAVRSAVALAAAVLAAGVLTAATPTAAAPVAPAPAQSPLLELDTPFVTTPDNVVAAMLELARVGPADHVIDLGSGDGRIVIAAAARGASGLGVEIDPQLVRRSRENAARAGVAERARFVVQDLFDTDLSTASVITIYLLPDVNVALRPRLLELAPGTRIVSHDWGLGDWEPDERMEVAAPQKTTGHEKVSRLYHWVVPARLGGTWTDNEDGAGLVLALEQRYQRLRGRVQAGGTGYRVADGRIRGREVALVLEPESGPGTSATFAGRLDGGRIAGRLQAVGAPARTVVLTRRAP